MQYQLYVKFLLVVLYPFVLPLISSMPFTFHLMHLQHLDAISLKRLQVHSCTHSICFCEH